MGRNTDHMRNLKAKFSVHSLIPQIIIQPTRTHSGDTF